MAARIFIEEILSSRAEAVLCNHDQKSSERRRKFNASVADSIHSTDSTVIIYADEMVPFNERASIGPNLEASIVPDLMRVYDSLTQDSSNTPHAARNSDIECTREGEQFQSFPPQASVPPQFDRNTPYTHNASLATISNTSHHEQQMPLTSNSGRNFQDATSRNNQDTKNQPQSQLAAGQAKIPAILAHEKRTLKSGALSPSSRKRSRADSDRSNSDTDTKSRKKINGNDGRWSKRFAWPDELHRDFVSAIFDVGLKHSSPSGILEQMGNHEQMITSERIKSHLQKYRLNRRKSKEEFMGSYDSALQKIKAGKMESDSTTISSGKVAAHLVLTTISDAKIEETNAHGSILNGGALQLPHLSTSEKCSPIGASMGYLMGLFFSLKQQLLAQRAAADNVSNFVPSISSQPIPPPLSQAPMPIPFPLSQAPINAKYPQNEAQQQTVFPSCSETQIANINPCEGFQCIAPAPILYQTPVPSIDHFRAPSPAIQRQRPLQSHFRDQQPQVDYPPTQQQHCLDTDGNKDGSAGTEDIMNHTSCASPIAAPRNNTSLKENDMMKADMRSQMAFQNKIRKFKETELNKCMTSNSSASPIDATFDGRSSNSTHNVPAMQMLESAPENGPTNNCSECGHNNEEGNVEQQHADFWNADVVDEDLFNFLCDV